jgi:hypothetical protein
LFIAIELQMLQCPCFRISVSRSDIYAVSVAFANADLCPHFYEEQRQNNEQRNRKSGGDERDLMPDAKTLRQTNGGREEFEHDFLQGKMHGGNIFNVRIVLKYDFVMTLGKRVQTCLELNGRLTAERESCQISGQTPRESSEAGTQARPVLSEVKNDWYEQLADLPIAHFSEFVPR